MAHAKAFCSLVALYKEACVPIGQVLLTEEVEPNDCARNFPRLFPLQPLLKQWIRFGLRNLTILYARRKRLRRYL